MVGSSGSYLVKVFLSFAALVVSGCGPDVAGGTGWDEPPVTRNSVNSVLDGVLVPYTLDIDENPLCADISIGGEQMGYSCALASWQSQLIAGKSVGQNRIRIYLIPMEAVDVNLSPPAAFDRNGSYLVLQTNESDSLPILTYSVETLRVTCDLSQLFENCGYQTA